MKVSNSKIANKTKIVGILNLTPDSFSDGGSFFEPKAALSHLQSMLEDGADIIDVGAESSRPEAKILSATQEWQRLKGILPQIILQIKDFNCQNNREVQVSLDSYHFENLVKAHEIGVSIINDISGLCDSRVIEFIAKNEITTILMHNLSIHANPSLIINPNLNVNREIVNWAQEKIEFLQKFGVKKSQLIFDPGIGFSKNSAQSLQILKNIESYRILGLPLYVGHSKKSCLDSLQINSQKPSEIWQELEITDKEDIKTNKTLQTSSPDDLKQSLKQMRAEKTLVVSRFLIDKNVDFLRIHDVKAHQQILSNLAWGLI